MYALVGLIVGAILTWLAERANSKDRPEYDRTKPDAYALILHLRQDLRLISFLLFGIIVLLGIIADRVH